MIRVTHIITGMAAGGAEMSLYKLLSGMDGSRFSSEVISLTGDGAIGEKIRGLVVPVRCLGMKPGMPDPLSLYRLAGWLRRDPPDVLQTWMYHADLLGGLSARLAGGIPVVWNIRNGNLDPGVVKAGTLWTIRACAALSGWLPVKIVSCSETASRVHTGMGYHAEKIIVIPNGFDLQTFQPDPAARISVRNELGLDHEARLVGLIARFDLVKDHKNFIDAATLLNQQDPSAHFLLCGDGVDGGNLALMGWIRDAGLADVFHLLGYRSDIPRLTAALDVSTCSSAYGEGFPNIIGEAMACGVPSVVTDLGDSAYVVGNTGIVVPQRDARALSEGWQSILAMDDDQHSEMGARARRRVEEKFSLPQVVKQYEALYSEILLRKKSQIIS
jgi:glycosyltransferase involved in cell wall biosynthesis